jgi:hypothetical protein
MVLQEKYYEEDCLANSNCRSIAIKRNCPALWQGGAIDSYVTANKKDLMP